MQRLTDIRAKRSGGSTGVFAPVGPSLYYTKALGWIPIERKDEKAWPN